jgi:hypothetical protein
VRPSTIIKAIRAELGPHLVKENYLKLRPRCATKSWGCCYVATEALYHLWGKENGYTPMRVPYVLPDGSKGQHWFLEQRASGLQVDITSDQFRGLLPDYENAVGTGFLTKKPSRRAQQIIDAVLN